MSYDPNGNTELVELVLQNIEAIMYEPCPFDEKYTKEIQRRFIRSRHRYVVAPKTELKSLSEYNHFLDDMRKVLHLNLPDMLLSKIYHFNVQESTDLVWFGRITLLEENGTMDITRYLRDKKVEWRQTPEKDIVPKYVAHEMNMVFQEKLIQKAVANITYSKCISKEELQRINCSLVLK
jgi:intein-encoded DNA endonuclease-like protein